MSSRPPLGVQQRQPQQRKLSGPALSQQRSLSQSQAQAQAQQQQQQQQHHQQQQQQQYDASSYLPPPPPSVRNNNNFNHNNAALSNAFPPEFAQQDPTSIVSPADPSGSSPALSVGVGRYGTQRRGGSRLRLELSHNDPSDAFSSPTVIESPGLMEPHKQYGSLTHLMMPLADGSDLGEMSPHHQLSIPPQHLDADVPIPFPQRRPKAVPDHSRREQPPPPPNPARKDTRPKPYTIELPAAAPRYRIRGRNEGQGGQGRSSALATASSSSTTGSSANYGCADFFPWSGTAGNHPEDQFNDTAIRMGYSEKQLVTPETQSAKTVLFHGLKQRSGLNALSIFFAGVLWHRRNAGQVTAPSTFKPPPRVTLTDTKKEVWLKDLTNSAIPLRKLSRSIPHGVRNKVLLDQCLNKNVPIDRAVWLAKCVGTNELRTFRRLGKGNNASVLEGERKWLKDWTLVIEQFIERVFFSSGEQNWKAKVNYAIQLATHLYAESLMDREHYLDWTVSSLESSHHSQLPMWIIIAQIYWKDLLRLRKYGRRLATALISHYHVIHAHEDRDIYVPLLSKLSHLLGTLMVATPENFVSPAVWVKYRDALKTCLPQGDEARHRSFAGINYRNEQLVASANRSQPAARIILVRNLDQVILEKPMPDEFPAQCWTVSKDKAALVRALLEWCTTLYRPGLAKVYVAHRILMHWRSTMGLDVTSAVLGFMEGEALEEKERKEALYHLVSELVRSGIFLVPQYIQWLIARGGLTDSQLVMPDGPPFSRLLAELPPHILGSSQRRSRDALLRRAGFCIADDAQDADAAIRHLRHALGLPVGVTDAVSMGRPFPIKKIARRIEDASRARKAEIASWLRNTVTGGELEHSSLNAFGQHELSTKLFNSIRRVFEAAQEFSVFADVLKMLTKCSNPEVLASIADTITRYTFVFAALGCLKNLFGILHGRLREVAREQGIGARPLLASLAYLASRVPGMDEVATQLKSDLAVSDRHNPVDACSPVSDNMVSRLQDDDGDLHEEVEKLLANGTSLDRNTMDRLFSAVIQRLQAYWTKGDEQQRVYGILMKRLRMFDPQHFDELMARWLLYVRGLNRRATILHLYPLLVSIGCLGMPAILATASESPNAPGTGNSRHPQSAVATSQIVQTTFRTRYMQEVLQLFMAPVSSESLLTPEERYRFGILQEQAKKESPRELLCLIQLALAEYTCARAQNDLEELPLDKEANQDRLLELLKLLVLKDPVGVAKALQIRGPDAQVAGWIDRMTTKLLVTAAGEGTRVTFEQVLNLTNEFTLPFCHVKLLLSLSSNDQQQNAADSGERVPSNVELFMNAMEKSMDAQRVSWIGMLPSLSPDLTHHLKNQAQTRFLNLLPSSRNPPSLTLDRSTLQMRLQKAENFLAIMDTIIRGSGPMGFRQHQLVPVMVERFTDILELLQTLTPLPSQAGGLGGWGGQGVSAAAAGGDNHTDLKSDILNHWLPLFLNFLTLHAQTFDTSKPGNEVRGRALIVCAGLIRELDLIHGPDFDTRQLGGRIFDLACVLVDNLAEDARLQCMQALKSPSDVKLRYIFSYQDNPHANLMLCHKERPTPMAMGTNTGTGSPAPGITPTHTPGVTPGQQQATGPQNASGAAGAVTGAGGSGNGGSYFNLPGHTQQAQAQGWHAAQQQQLQQQQQQQQYHQLHQQQQQQQQQAGTGPMPSPAISINTNLTHLNLGNSSNPPTPSPMNPARPAMVMVANPWGGYSWVPTMGGPQERLTPFNFRQWEMLSEPTSQVGENDTAVNLMLFDSRKVQ
ncbi:RNA polymerase II mediator complex subunit [Neurospora sp. IMI 360204]|nr:RNA polymerase II mediator complex subunit [Neurospora sp. IMI 360204]